MHSTLTPALPGRGVYVSCCRGFYPDISLGSSGHISRLRFPGGNGVSLYNGIGYVWLPDGSWRVNTVRFGSLLVYDDNGTNCIVVALSSGPKY